MRNLQGPIFLTILLLLSGCVEQEVPQPPPEHPQSAQQKQNEELPEPAVSVALVDQQGLAALLEENRGNVVLVDFWATWCQPCTEQFPHTVKLHRELADQGLKVITVSFDDSQNPEAVLKFLIENKASCTNLLSQYGGGAESYEKFQIFTGSLPHYRVYDRQGKLHREFSSGDPEQPYSEEAIDQTLHNLLKASP